MLDLVDSQVGGRCVDAVEPLDPCRRPLQLVACLGHHQDGVAAFDRLDADRVAPAAALAAMVISIERLLIEEARAAVIRGDASPAAKRALRRTCDRAFELLEKGVRSYGRRSRAP